MSEAATERGRGAAHRRPLHVASVVVLVVVLSLTVALSVLAARSISSATDRVLATQTSEVASALQATTTQIQQPLVAAERVATIGGVDAFERFVRSEVGPGAPFTSASLWRVHGGHVTPLSVVPPAPLPQLLRHPARATRFLSTVPKSQLLTVVGLLGARVRSLGYAERLPGSTNGYVVYAEAALPDPSRVTFAPDSPFAGLDFAAYFGAVVASPTLMLTSVALPPTGPSETSVVPFASAKVTVLSTIVGAPPGVLAGWVPWVIGVLGLLLALLAAALTELLVRRRDAAESEVTARTHAYDEQRDIASTLQHAMLPSERPVFPGVEMATRYVAGVRHLDVGGDWFDTIPLDDDSIFLTVGDVSGRGLLAATTMSSLRHAIRAYALQGDDPDDVVGKLDGIVDVARDGCFATVLCCKVDVASRTALVASAGHTPALLVDSRGARFLDAPANTPVGVASGSPTRGIRLDLEAGSVLVAYTDGLVERRGEDLDQGLDRLRGAPVDWAAPTDVVLAGVVAALVPEGADDDVAVLVVRLLSERTAGSGVPRPWRERARRRFVNAPSSVAAARRFVAAALPDAAVAQAESVAVCVSELATNALLHANTDFEVAVLADDAAGAVRVEVADAGAEDPVLRGPPPSVPRGRGLQLLEGMSDRWGVERTAGAVTKCVWFELDDALALPAPRRGETTVP